MHRSWSRSELPPPPWVDPNDSLVHDSYAKHQKPFKRQQELREERRRSRREDARIMRFPQEGSSPPIRTFPPLYHPQAAAIRKVAVASASSSSERSHSHLSMDASSVRTSSKWSGSSESLASVSSDIVRTVPDRAETYQSYHNRPMNRNYSHEVDTILGFKVLRRESDHETAPVEESPGTADQPWLISKSHYNGDELRAGPHSVRVTKIPHPGSSERHLFRWVHMEQPMMDFGIFTERISQIPLVEPEKQQLKDFVSDVRSKAMQRLFTNGQGCRGLFHLEPGVIRRGAFTWICMPYFTYDEYSALGAAAKTTSPCPTQTLMQAYSSSSSKKMDLVQAIRKVTQPRTDCVLHISQLWCIIVGQCE